MIIDTRKIFTNREFAQQMRAALNENPEWKVTAFGQGEETKAAFLNGRKITAWGCYFYSVAPTQIKYWIEYEGCQEELEGTALEVPILIDTTNGTIDFVEKKIFEPEPPKAEVYYTSKKEEAKLTGEITIEAEIVEEKSKPKREPVKKEESGEKKIKASDVNADNLEEFLLQQLGKK